MLILLQLPVSRLEAICIPHNVLVQRWYNDDALVWEYKTVLFSKELSAPLTRQ